MTTVDERLFIECDDLKFVIDPERHVPASPNGHLLAAITNGRLCSKECLLSNDSITARIAPLAAPCRQRHTGQSTHCADAVGDEPQRPLFQSRGL